jgi:hypothetical protein
MSFADGLLEYFFQIETKKEAEREEDRIRNEDYTKALRLSYALSTYAAPELIPEAPNPLTPPAPPAPEPPISAPDPPVESVHDALHPDTDASSTTGGDTDFTPPPNTGDVAVSLEQPNAAIETPSEATVGGVEFTPPATDAPAPRTPDDDFPLADSYVPAAELDAPAKSNAKLVALAVAGAVVVLVVVIVAIASGGSSSKSTTPTFSISLPRSPLTTLTGGSSNVIPPPPPGASNVIISKNGAYILGDICQGGTLQYNWLLVGIAPNTPVVVDFTGRGLPASITFRANSNENVTRSYPVAPGAGQWTDKIISIGGKPPPTSGSFDLTPVQC